MTQSNELLGPSHPSKYLAALRQTAVRQPGKARLALILIALMPLAACGAGSLAHDPFSDAAARCDDRQGEWLPGCATKRNIVAVAEHPGDLDTPRGETPRDSMRRDALISGYGRSSTASSEPRASTQAGAASGGRKEP